MISKRYDENPLLMPNKMNAWESEATFNGCPVKEKNKVKLFYRAISAPRFTKGVNLELSTIGLAESDDGDTFYNRRQLIRPEYEWEQYGCEDPRVTKYNGKYYIFYTALSRYPFEPDGIKVGLGISKDLKKVEKYRVTTFNSKAMALFPDKVKGKMAAILTADTDNPPAKIGIALFSEEKEIWSKRYWNNWYRSIKKYQINLPRNPEDHIELGAAPIKTPKGWLIIYSYIRNYFNSKEVLFEVHAALLDLNNPYKIIGHTRSPLLTPKETYEIYGKVPDIVFPSGGYINKNELHVFYGAADTVCCAAKFRLSDVMEELLHTPYTRFSLKRYKNNPIIKPNPKNEWESYCTFNPGVIYENNRFHIVYRAMSPRGKSVMGYASSKNGFKIEERLDEPIYTPREPFEIKHEDGYSGCEDPRLVKMDDRIFMFYTAFDGNNPPSVALTSIKLNNFLNKNWRWDRPVLISPIQDFNKNACIFPEKINGKYIALHRINNSIDFHYLDDLKFEGNELAEETNWIMPRKGRWDSAKIGIAGPPIKTKYGWLLIYHGKSDIDEKYRLGALLLDSSNPEQVIARTDNPILEPLYTYETEGEVNDVIFSCGAVLVNEKIYVYYGGADRYIGVATIELEKLIKEIKRSIYE